MEAPRTTDAPPSDRPTHEAEPPPTLLRAMMTMLLGLALGLVALLLLSAFVVYATGVTARWLGLPELHVLIAFLGLVAFAVIALVGARLGAFVVRAGDVVAHRVSAVGEATDGIIDALDEIPTVVLVEPPSGQRAVSQEVTGGFRRGKHRGRR